MADALEEAQGHTTHTHTPHVSELSRCKFGSNGTHALDEAEYNELENCRLEGKVDSNNTNYSRLNYN